MIWSYETGMIVTSAPALAYQKMFIGSWDNRVYALDPFTGKVMWIYKTGRDVQSAPTIADGKVFAGSYDDSIYALDAETGKVVWQYKTGDDVHGSLAVAGGKIFAGSFDGKIYAFGSALAKPVVGLDKEKDERTSSTAKNEPAALTTIIIGVSLAALSLAVIVFYVLRAPRRK
jgi:outer membrane protein assembly factor BamB